MGCSGANLKDCIQSSVGALPVQHLFHFNALKGFCCMCHLYEIIYILLCTKPGWHLSHLYSHVLIRFHCSDDTSWTNTSLLNRTSYSVACRNVFALDNGENWKKTDKISMKDNTLLQILGQWSRSRYSVNLVISIASQHVTTSDKSVTFRISRAFEFCPSINFLITTQCFGN